eukprot:tig00001542_g9314.t1
MSNRQVGPTKWAELESGLDWRWQYLWYELQSLRRGGYVDTIDAQYFAFPARGMAVFHSSMPKPACLHSPAGCPKPASPSDLPSIAVLELAARLRGLDPANSPTLQSLLAASDAATVRMLYTGRSDLDYAALRYADIVAERTAAALPLRANESAVPPANSSASDYFTNSTGFYSYAGCIGTAFGFGACGGLAPSTTATTLAGYRGALDLASMEAAAVEASTHVCCKYSPYSPPICMAKAKCPTSPLNMVGDIAECAGCTGPLHPTSPSVCCLGPWGDLDGTYYKCVFKSRCAAVAGTEAHSIFCGGDDVCGYGPAYQDPSTSFDKDCSLSENGGPRACCARATQSGSIQSGTEVITTYTYSGYECKTVPECSAMNTGSSTRALLELPQNSRSKPRSLASAVVASADTAPSERDNWYMPTYTLRYCPGTGSQRLPLDVFEPRVPGGELEAPSGSPLAFAPLLPTGHTTNPFPMFPHTLFKSAAPQLLHGIVRVPLFPTFAQLGITSSAERASLSSAAERSDLPLPGSVFHLVVRMSWSVSQSGATLVDARPLFNASVHVDDGFIVQNAMPRYASAGYGALEGKHCEAADTHYGFYVVGDTVIRLKKSSSAAGQSSLGGSPDASIALTQSDAWSPSRKLWYSVGAVAFQDGALYVAREAMSASTGSGLASDKIDADVTGKKASESDPVSVDTRTQVYNADKPVMGPVVVLHSFVPGVRGVLAPETAGNSTSTRDKRLFFYTHRSAEVFAVRTNCSAGTVFDLAAGDCSPLPGGYFSNTTGLLILSEAGVCRENSFAPPGSTDCTPCPKGTFAANGSASCTECPQNSFGEEEGGGCQRCPANSYTPSQAWTSKCLLCKGELL